MPGPTVPAIGSKRQNYSIQFLTAPTADTPGTTVALVFDSKRYLFGHLAEGTQRSLIQRGFGLKKVTDLFLTGQTKWTTNGGIMGMILTIADVLSDEVAQNGVRPRLHIHGAPKLLHTMATARRFIFRTGMPLTIHEVDAHRPAWPLEPSFVDDNVRVWSIPIRDANASAGDQKTSQVNSEQTMRAKIVNDMFDSDWRRDRLIETPFKDVKMPAMVFIRDKDGPGLTGVHCANHESTPQIAPDQIVKVRNAWPASLIGTLPPAHNLPSNVAVAYVIRGHAQRGNFDPQKAKSFGLKPGPIYSTLTAGESVTLEDGRVITPDMVLGPTKVGKGVAIFDLPAPGHAEYLRSVLDQAPEDALSDVVAAVWILGANVGSSDVLKQLFKRLDTLQHFVSDPDVAPNHLAFESAALSNLRLAKINPGNFSVPFYDNERPYSANAAQSRDLSPAGDSIAVKPGLRINLEPKYAVDCSEIPPFAELSTLDELELPASIIETNAPPKATSTAPERLSEPEIVTLGTGSSHPSKTRNVSATLIRLPADQGNVLLDCGENTVGQLRRTFPSEQYEDILRRTQALWISHLHADHHLGTVSFLQARARAFDALGEAGKDAERTIYLMSERNMMDWIHEYSSVEPSVFTETGLVPVVCKDGIGPTIDGAPFDISSSPSSAIQRVDSVRVSHCNGAQGVSITFKSGFKVSYSGDCRPSSHFCKIGAESDVLIHEATFDDEMKGDAVAKKHSTTSEALGVGLEMRAKNVVLTHFSQRYPKVPKLANVKTGRSIQYEEASADQESEPVEANGPASDTTGGTEQQDIDNAATTAAPEPAVPTNGSSPASDSIMPTCIAFDGMRIKVSEIAHASKYYPAMQQLFDLQEAAAEKRRRIAREEMERQMEAKAKINNKQREKGKGGSGERRSERPQSAAAEGGKTNGEQLHDQNRSIASNGVDGSQDRNNHSMPGTPMSNRARKRAARDAARQRSKEGVTLGSGVDVEEDEGSPLKKRREAA